MLRACTASGDRQKMGYPAPSDAKSTTVPNGYPARLWCIRDMTLHRYANCACSTCGTAKWSVRDRARGSNSQCVRLGPSSCLSFPK